MRRLCGIALVALAVVVVASAQAGTERSAACPAPKPLPAGVKKPAKGANATQLANFVLALPQRKPCDVNLFTSAFWNGRPGAYPQGRPMRPATGSVPSESKVRAQLVAFMRGSPNRAAALRLFDQAEVRARIASPSLRAAYAAIATFKLRPILAVR